MSNVIVIATFQAKPGSESAVQEALQDVIAQTHAEEGCRTYALHVSNADPAQMVIVERWDDQAALQAHFTQPYIAALGEQAGALLAEPPTVAFCSALPAGDPAKGTLAGA